MSQPVFKRDRIRQELAELEGKVLSFYLNTSPDSEEWKIRLKNGLKKLEQYHALANPKDAQVISSINQNIHLAVRDLQRNLKNSLICFATKNQLLLYPFHFPVENEFSWHTSPQTEQLERLFELYSRTGLILVQSQRITLITSTLAELEDEQHYEMDLKTESWKQYKGLAFGAIISSSASHQDKFDRRLQENQTRWFKKMIPIIHNYRKERKWQKIYLLGPSPLTNMLAKQLQLPISAEIHRNVANLSAQEILEETIFALNEH